MSLWILLALLVAGNDQARSQPTSNEHALCSSEAEHSSSVRWWSKDPSKEHAMLSSKAPTALTSVSQILASSRGIVAPLGKDVDVSLTDRDPVLLMDQGPSYFKTARFPAQAGLCYEGSVTSHLKVLSFPKRMLVPILSVLDETGGAVAGTNQREELAPSMSAPLRLRASVAFEAPRSGDYVVLVAADNTQEVATIGTISFTAGSGGSGVRMVQTDSLKMPVRSGPMGKVVLRVEAKPATETGKGTSRQ